MNFSDRKEVISFLNGFEDKYATEDWICGKVQVWPILKTYMFLKIFWEAQSKPIPKSTTVRFLISAKKLIKKVVAHYHFVKYRFTPVEFLFFSGMNFRENFEGKSIHKFYDPIGDLLEKRNLNFIFLEYGELSRSETYQNRGANISSLYHYFEGKVNLEKINFSEWSGFEEFRAFLEMEIDFSHIDFNSTVSNVLHTVFVWEAVFLFVLEKTKPKKVFLLSYYNIPCFGLIIAAKKRGIESIDIQHGTQGSFHVAYSGFKKGYSVIPDLFWLWDEQTEQQLRRNVPILDFQTIVGGNPWHFFLKQKEHVYEKKKQNILFTLQPISPLIYPYVFEVMNNTLEKYDWLIRSHPRIHDDEKGQFIEQLVKLGVYDEKLWRLANETPLPILLRDVDLHISMFSGCIQEAADLGIFSIILDKIGELTYRQLIDQGLAVGGIENAQELYISIRENIGKKRIVDVVNLECVLDLIF